MAKNGFIAGAKRPILAALPLTIHICFFASKQDLRGHLRWFFRRKNWVGSLLLQFRKFFRVISLEASACATTDVPTSDFLLKNQLNDSLMWHSYWWQTRSQWRLKTFLTDLPHHFGTKNSNEKDFLKRKSTGNYCQKVGKTSVAWENSTYFHNSKIIDFRWSTQLLIIAQKEVKSAKKWGVDFWVSHSRIVWPD